MNFLKVVLKSYLYMIHYHLMYPDNLKDRISKLDSVITSQKVRLENTEDLLERSKVRRHTL